MLDIARNLFKRVERKIEVRKILSACPDRELIGRIKDNKLTYLSQAKLASISNTCREIEACGLNGIFVEAGCALGGSAILVGTLKSPSRHLNVYDVFGLIPSPTDEDPADVQQRYKTIIEGTSDGIGGDKYYGYEENLLEKVKANFSSFGLEIDGQNTHLIKGMMQDTMHIEGDFAFAHIDVDWYDPVKTCLERLFPRLVVGGSIILDDHYDWGGCRKAVGEFLRALVGKVTLDDSPGSLKLAKTHA